MKKSIYYSLLMSAMMSVAAAEETRQVDKHEHGVGELNIAVEGSAINLEFMIPGADIVGFEYEAKSDSDIALVNTALSKFQDFENIFMAAGKQLYKSYIFGFKLFLLQISRIKFAARCIPAGSIRFGLWRAGIIWLFSDDAKG